MKQVKGKINNKFTITNTYNKNINSLINKPLITNYWKINNNNRNIFSRTSTDNNNFNKLTTNSILFHPGIFVDSLGFYELTLGAVKFNNKNNQPQLNFSGTGTPTLPNGRNITAVPLRPRAANLNSNNKKKIT